MKRGTISSIGLIGGAGIGALAMYLLDPHQGAKRRQNLSQTASDALRAAEESFGSVQQSAAEAGSAASDYAHQLVGRIGDLADHAREYLSSAKGQANEYAQNMTDYADSYMHPRRATSGTAVASYTLGTTGVLLLGIGAWYLLEPTRGRQRREAIYGVIHDFVGQTGESFNAAGRYLRDQYAALTHGEVRHGDDNMNRNSYGGPRSDDMVDSSPHPSAATMSGGSLSI